MNRTQAKLLVAVKDTEEWRVAEFELSGRNMEFVEKLLIRLLVMAKVGE